jgi:hypothetical protein
LDYGQKKNIPCYRCFFSLSHLLCSVVVVVVVVVVDVPEVVDSIVRNTVHMLDLDTNRHTHLDTSPRPRNHTRSPPTRYAVNKGRNK